MSFRAFSAALWFISTLFIFWIALVAIFGSTNDLPLIASMLTRPQIADRATPILILFLFSWALIEIARKQRRVRQQHVAVNTFTPEIAAPDSIADEPKAPSPKNTRADLRADLISECSRRNPFSLHEAVPAAAVLDANSLASTYVPLHVYAWTLPVLGFIGTASGMASAIRGFKDVLGGGQVQVDVLAGQLSQSVIPGLSAAFDTTILALGASLVIYLCTNAVRSWDEEALERLDRICITFLSGIPQPNSSDSGLGSVLAKISEQLSSLLNISPVLTEAANSIYAAADCLAGAASSASAIGPAADALASAGAQSTSAADAISMAAKTLVSASEELQNSFSAPYHITITREPRP